MKSFLTPLGATGRSGETGLRAASDVGVLRALIAAARQIPDSAAHAPMAPHDCEETGQLEGGDLFPDGPAFREVVRLAVEVARRVAVTQARLTGLHGPEDVAVVAGAELAGANRERLLLLNCDAGNGLMHATIVTEGTADRLLIPVREVVALVLQQGGRAFAIAHNHPSGDTTPSPADIEGTRAMAAAAKTVGLRFLGHVIVADGWWQAVGSDEIRECSVDG